MAGKEQRQNKKKNIHAILVAYPLQGHVIPAVNLAVTLASNGVTVSFINTHFIHHRTLDSAADGGDDDIFAAVRERGLDVRYSTVSDGLPVEFDRSQNHDEYMESLLHVMSDHVDAAVEKVTAAAAAVGEKVNSLIADTFFVWGADLAEKYNLFYVSFWSEAALVYSLYFHMDILGSHGHFDCGSCNRKDAISYIPGIQSIDPKDMPSYLQSTDCSTVVHQIISKSFEQSKRADFVISNTIQQLEPDCISALRTLTPFYSIGPIFPSGCTRTAIPTSLWSQSDCTPWLDAHPTSSVLYISFGSYAHLPLSSLHELAKALLLLKTTPFLWVIRPDIVNSSQPEPLSHSFIEATRDRGMVVQWCPQAEVLSHRAIGGFLTHCGWNSVLESIWFGVPLLCYPLLTDQFCNRKLVVEWGVGVDLCADGGEPTAEEVAAAAEMVVGGAEVRKKVGEVRKVMVDSLKGYGEKNMKEFIDKLEDACCL